jgi:hypothetical protein
MPGETGLRLLGPVGSNRADEGSNPPGNGRTPWYGQLWNSVTSAAGTASPSGPAAGPGAGTAAKP